MTSGVSFTATGSSSQLPVVSYQFLIRDAHIDLRTGYGELSNAEDQTRREWNENNHARRDHHSRHQHVDGATDHARHGHIKILYCGMSSSRAQKPPPLRIKKVRSLVPGKVDIPTYWPLCRQTIIVTIRRESCCEILRLS